MKIIIRELDVDDAKISWKWRNDPEVWRLTGRKWNNHVTYEIEKEWIKKIKEEKNSLRFAICVGEENEYVENVQLTNIEEESAIFHIFIGNKKFWGKGIGSKATELLIEQAKSLKTLREIRLSVKVDNKVAIKIYNKAGFVIEKKDNDDFLMVYKL